MMLALLIYSFANGIVSSRRIERATHRHIRLRFVATNSHPNHNMIATFQSDNLGAVTESLKGSYLSQGRSTTPQRQNGAYQHPHICTRSELGGWVVIPYPTPHSGDYGCGMSLSPDLKV